MATQLHTTPGPAPAVTAHPRLPEAARLDEARARLCHHAAEAPRAHVAAGEALLATMLSGLADGLEA